MASSAAVLDVRAFIPLTDSGRDKALPLYRQLIVLLLNNRTDTLLDLLSAHVISREYLLDQGILTASNSQVYKRLYIGALEAVVFNSNVIHTHSMLKCTGVMNQLFSRGVVFDMLRYIH